jgi:hypothetical protein
MTAAARPLSAGRRAWIERVAPDWAARAANLRLAGDPCADRRASVIESIVAGFHRELAGEPPDPPRPRAAVPSSPPPPVPALQFEFIV